MKNWFKYAAISTGLLAATASVQAYEDNDFQLWLKMSASGKVTENIKVGVDQEMKFGDNAGQFYDNETLMMVSRPATEWLKIGLGYRQVFELKSDRVVGKMSDGEFSQKSESYWRREDRPTADFVFHKKLESSWKLEDRVRLEYRDKDGTDAYIRVRNRIKVKTPYKMTELSINPYAAWELNWEDLDVDSSDKLDRHRIYLGGSAKFNDIITGGAYYCLQMDKKGDDWRNYHVLGLEIGAKF